ncbi:MAG: hypothetical protein LBT44_10155 [Clostridiales bacterium]|jgi:hypothetical protein|nr:hypothetical protein [Clostridiales bacterium]
MIDTIHVGVTASYLCEDETRSTLGHLAAETAHEDVWTLAEALNSLQMSPLYSISRTDLSMIVDLG